jgi:hypothetical protein
MRSFEFKMTVATCDASAKTLAKSPIGSPVETAGNITDVDSQ